MGCDMYEHTYRIPIGISSRLYHTTTIKGLTVVHLNYMTTPGNYSKEMYNVMEMKILMRIFKSLESPYRNSPTTSFQ
jgi:hypothetical protein